MTSAANFFLYFQRPNTHHAARTTIPIDSAPHVAPQVFAHVTPHVSAHAPRTPRAARALAGRPTAAPPLAAARAVFQQRLTAAIIMSQMPPDTMKTPED